MSKFFSLIKQFDWVLFLIILLLMGLGLAVQYGLALNTHDSSFSNFNKQILFAGMGLALFFIFSFLDYRALKNSAYILYVLALFVLLAVLFFGQVYHGTRGWFNFGIFNFQAVELVKVIIIISLAKFWAHCTREVVLFRYLILSGVLVALPVLLVILQPDMGSALLLIGFWLIMITVISRKFSHLAIIFLVIGILVVTSWFFVLKDYQKNRVLTFLNPQMDPLGQGYQVTQSIIAVGSGEFLGRGLGLGTQSQLKFLPAAETDFVFAVVSEELGFVGAFLILGLFILLFCRLIKIARAAYDDFSLFLILGVMSIFFIQILINVGMNIGLAPVMGIPLPLISYGGSSLITSLMALGIAESVAFHSVKYSRAKSPASAN